jgi:prolyl 4-hydroxylase
MNQEWQEWIKTNIARGCDLAEISRILRTNGFSDEEILKNLMISDHLAMPAVIKPVAVDYRKMANPLLVRKIKDFGGYRVDDDRLQLFVIPNFLSAKLCDELMVEVSKNLRPSTITSGDDKYGFRTSTTGDLDPAISKATAKLESRISRTLGIRIAWSEQCQGQKYLVGQEFKPHTDYFEPGSNEFRKFAADKGQRTWTFTVYLNECEAGGATDFPKINQRFYPKKGQATIWNNLNTDGSVNEYTLHHGMPVEKGEKLIITKWFRDKGSGSPFISE